MLGRLGDGRIVAAATGEDSREEARPRMMRFAVNRIIWFIPTILAMAALTFLIMHATPGSPFDVSDKQRPEDIKRLEALYGLDKPLPEQFVRYLWNAVHLDFGISYHARPQTVNEIIGRTFPISLHLGAMATFFAVAVGMTLGVLAAVNQNGWLDYASVTMAVLFYSMPSFVMGFLLILLFVGLAPGHWGQSRISCRGMGTADRLGAADHRARRSAARHPRQIHSLQHDRSHPL